MKTCLFRIIIVIISSCILTSLAIAETKDEKPIVLKGLSIGMDINEARRICESLLGKDWTISEIDNIYSLEEGYGQVYKPTYRNENSLPIDDKKGFSIKDKKGYLSGYSGYGFIGDDKGSGKVAQIIFSGELTDYIFSTKEVYADDFVNNFIKIFGLPALPWIFRGWRYLSPYGYELTIMINKSIDINKNTSTILNLIDMYILALPSINYLPSINLRFSSSVITAYFLTLSRR